MSENWAYRNYLRWKKDYPKCAGSSDPDKYKQSPINIDSSKVADCNETCRLSMRYKPSRCYVSNMNRTPTIRFDPGSFIKFKSVLYELKEMKIHTPSMHTVNGEFYDMEIDLYHYLNSSDKSAGGVIIGILLQRGSADSDANHFLSQFINQIPADEIEGEKDIKVSKNWSAEMLYPNIKSFYYYQGSLPTPPCDDANWTWIMFEETANIEDTLYNNFNIVFQNNTRPVRALKSRTVYYNNSPKLDSEDDYLKTKLEREITKLVRQRNEIGKINYRITDKDKERLNIENPGQLANLQAVKTNNWFVNNRQTIKNILITIILLLTVFASIKMTKNLVRSGIITDYAQKQIKLMNTRELNSAKREGTQANTNRKLNAVAEGSAPPLNGMPTNNMQSMNAASMNAASMNPASMNPASMNAASMNPASI